MKADTLHLRPWCIVMLGLVVCWTGVFDRAAWTPDEPRVVAMSLEMARTGRFIVPHLAGEPFVEKPPLFYAATGLLLRVFPDPATAAGIARAGTVIWGLGVLLFTGLIAARYGGKATGWISVAILSTMIGFVENFHWIRVDAALAFFVIAAVWSLIEGTAAGIRKRYLALAGMFAAGAFLSKGFIGPVLIAIPLTGLLIRRHVSGVPQRSGRSGPAGWIAAGILFAVIVGVWVFLFRKNVDDATWHQWFWVNHFGRFSGEAVQKGHMHPHDPFYYIKTIAMYTLPWLPFTAAWFIGALKRFRMQSSNQKADVLSLMIWSVGSYAFLSIPTTKRDIYMLPVLPVFAIMAGLTLKRYLEGETPARRWVNRYAVFWLFLAVLLLGVFMLSFYFARYFTDAIPERMRIPVTTPGARHALAAVPLAVAAGTAAGFIRRKITVPAALFISSVMLYAGLFIVPMKMLDSYKDLGPGTQAFLDGIPRDERPRIAGWNFSQTDLGMFYICDGWAVPQIRSKDRIEDILAGRDAIYSSVILNQVRDFSDVVKEPYSIVLEGHPRDDSRYRGLFWVKRLTESGGNPADQGLTDSGNPAENGIPPGSS